MVAAETEPAAVELGVPAGAAQRDLRVRIGGHGRVLIQAMIRDIIIGDSGLFYKAFSGGRPDPSNQFRKLE